MRHDHAPERGVINHKTMTDLLFLIGSAPLLAWVLRKVHMPLEDLTA